MSSTLFTLLVAGGGQPAAANLTLLERVLIISNLKRCNYSRE